MTMEVGKRALRSHDLRPGSQEEVVIEQFENLPQPFPAGQWPGQSCDEEADRKEALRQSSTRKAGSGKEGCRKGHEKDSSENNVDRCSKGCGESSCNCRRKKIDQDPLRERPRCRLKESREEEISNETLTYSTCPRLAAVINSAQSFVASSISMKIRMRLLSKKSYALPPAV